MHPGLVNAPCRGEFGDLQRPLLLACSSHNVAAAQLLLLFGANPNQRGHKGLTPLHHAIAAGSVRIVALLLGRHPLLFPKYTERQTMQAAHLLGCAQGLGKGAALEDTGSTTQPGAGDDTVPETPLTSVGGTRRRRRRRRQRRQAATAAAAAISAAGAGAGVTPPVEGPARGEGRKVGLLTDVLATDVEGRSPLYLACIK